MTGTKSRPIADRLSELAREPYRYDFWQALRLLECAFPGNPRLGRSVRPAEDPVRLGQQPSITFPAGPIATFERHSGAAAVHGRLRVFLFGLLGPNGPLPLHLTEYVIDRVRPPHRDPTLAAFLDVFHHRLLSLFWRAHGDAHPAVELDRPEQDRFGGYLDALAGFRGVPAPGAGERLDRVRRCWSGHFARQARPPESLRALLEEFFRVPARVEEFVGRWVPMPATGTSRLGQSNAALGTSAFLGTSLWDRSQTVRAVLGPMDFARFRRLLPSGGGWTRLGRMMRTFLGDELTWEARLVLRAEDVPALRLDGACHLGWTSWLGKPRDRDADDLLLHAETRFTRTTDHDPGNLP